MIEHEIDNAQFIFLFFESALELYPISKEKKSNNTMKRLLDSSIDQNLLKNLKYGYKRGRPDIIHSSLLNIVFSPLFESKKVGIYIHTRQNYIIMIPWPWKVPASYN